MKRTFTFFSIALISLFACTACFDLDEYLFFKKDGSGKFSFIVDMSKMMSMSKMLGDEAKKEDDGSAQVNSAFDKKEESIKAIKGISHYTRIEDTVNYKFGFSFDFTNVTALNKALNIVFSNDSAGPVTDYTYFEYKNNQLMRLEPNNINSLISGSSSPQPAAAASSTKNKLFDFDALFSDVTYNTTYEFEEAVDSVSNENSLLNNSRTRVSLSCHPLAKDSASMACSLKNKIFLK